MIGYNDNHVDYVPEPRFSELIASAGPAEPVPVVPRVR